MRFFVDDFMGATAAFTLEERGAYVSLLCYSWTNGGAPLPDDPVRLGRICGVAPDYFDQHLRPALVGRFEVSGGQWLNRRLTEEWAHAETQTAAAQVKGAKSGQVRRAKLLAGQNDAAPAATLVAASGVGASSGSGSGSGSGSFESSSSCGSSPVRTAVQPQFTKPVQQTLADLAERPALPDAAATRVLEALNTARRRLNPKSRDLRATQTNLGEIAGRLREGHSLEDFDHVIAAWEVECLTDVKPGEFDPRKYFDAITPFRAQNFARKLARPVDQRQLERLRSQAAGDRDRAATWDGEDE